MSAREEGFSMIGLMTGLAISMIGIVGLLGIYRSLVYQSVQSTHLAEQSGQVSTGLLAAQIALQGAGYGIGTSASAASTGVDLVLLKNAAVSGSALTGTVASISSASETGNALVWGSSPTMATYECRALVAINGGLEILRANSACASAAAFATTNWTPETTLVADGHLQAQPSSLSAQKVSCSPYGKGSPAPSIEARVTAESATTALRRTEVVCIPNITS